MKTDSILDCMEYLSTEVIAEADSYRPAKKANAWLKWGAAAACLCICIAGAVRIIPDLMKQHRGQDTEPARGTEIKEIMPAGDNTNEVSGPVERPKEGNDYNEEKLPKQFMISHYDSSLNTGDMAVSNGCSEMSNSLKAAVSELGDSVRYRVVVEMFRDGVAIGSDSPEVSAESERLFGEGYITAHESINDGYQQTVLFTLHATSEQLLSFPAAKDYGYYISLYDEYLGLEEPSVGPGLPEYNGSFANAAEYPAEVLEIRQAISDAAAAGELPYVYEARILEDPLRIEVLVSTTDEDLINELKNKYDPEGKYIVVEQGKTAEVPVF